MNVIEAKLRSFYQVYESNNRLESCRKLINLVLSKGCVNYQEDIVKGKFPMKYGSPAALIRIFTNKLGLTEQETELILDWSDGNFTNRFPEFPDLSYHDKIYHCDKSNIVTGLLYEDGFVIDPFQESKIKISSKVFIQYFKLVYNFELDAVRYAIFGDVLKCPNCNYVLSINQTTGEFYDHDCEFYLYKGTNLAVRNDFTAKYRCSLAAFYIALKDDKIKFGITTRLDRKSYLKADSLKFLAISSSNLIATLEYLIKCDFKRTSEFIDYSEWKDFKESFRKNFQSLKDSSSTHYNISIYL